MSRSGNSFVRRMCWPKRWLAFFLGLGVIFVSGCETLNPITLGVGLASYAATGKGLADHAIGTLTSLDCNILDGLLSAERKICEPHGSLAAQTGFKGLFAGRPETSPRLRLSERRVNPTPALNSMHFDVTEHAPVLRLSESILPRIESSSQRVSAPQLDQLVAHNL